MQHRLLFRVLLALLVLTGGRVSATESDAIEIQDLPYGDVLFHFYREDYFTAITRLMAAQERNELKHHDQDAQMLLGGLELSYGLPNTAERQLRKTLTTAVDRDVRNRAWYYLGKIAYQRGYYERARNILLNFEPPSDQQLTVEHALLLALTEMKMGKYQEAADHLKDINVQNDMETYLRLDRGVALLQLGWVEAGREALEIIGLTQTSDPEFRALRDRANLNLGYEMLRAKRADTALTFLNRVRLNGPYSQAALLGAGWADVVAEDFENALTPWLELIKRNHYDAAVQEAYIAVPFAFEKLNDDARAIQYYKSAISRYDQELDALENATRAVKTGLLDNVISQLPADFSGGWLNNDVELKDMPGAPYLIEVLASNAFQEQLKNYRDLAFLDRQLERWLHDIGLLRDMVDTRRQANEQRVPRVRERLGLNEAATLESRFRTFRDKLAAQTKSNDPLGLATTKERRQWEKLISMEARIGKHGDAPELQALAEKTHWLKGVLYWQIQADYPQRLWDIKKTLKQLEGPIKEVLTRRDVVAKALESTNAGFLGYDDRIDVLQTRIELLHPRIEPVLKQIGEALKSIALKALAQRHERLVSYRSQAHYALARIYDQLAQKQSDIANEDGQ